MQRVRVAEQREKYGGSSGSEGRSGGTTISSMAVALPLVRLAVLELPSVRAQ